MQILIKQSRYTSFMSVFLGRQSIFIYFLVIIRTKCISTLGRQNQLFEISFGISRQFDDVGGPVTLPTFYVQPLKFNRDYLQTKVDVIRQRAVVVSIFIYIHIIRWVVLCE